MLRGLGGRTEQEGGGEDAEAQDRDGDLRRGVDAGQPQNDGREPHCHGPGRRVTSDKAG